MPNMMVNLALGDAYGRGFEFASANAVKLYNNGETYRGRQKDEIGNGRYTDDTQRAIALAELMIENQEWTSVNIAQKFIDVYKRDVRGGYSGRMSKILGESTDGQDMISKIDPMSDGSGCVMGVAPLGYHQNIATLWARAKTQAQVTHNTPTSVACACAGALLNHYFIYKLGPKADAPKFIEKYVSGDWHTPWDGPVSVLAEDCLKAAITVLLRANTMKEVLIESIAFTGDVDTVAAIACAAAANCDEIDKQIPEDLYLRLENQTYGKNYLYQLDQALIDWKSKQT